jgi:DNA-binding NtrC family response regulator
LEDIEAQAIRFALSHYRGQMSEAARRLKIGRSTLYRKLDINNMMAGHENA